MFYWSFGLCVCLCVNCLPHGPLAFLLIEVNFPSSPIDLKHFNSWSSIIIRINPYEIVKLAIFLFCSLKFLGLSPPFSLWSNFCSGHMKIQGSAVRRRAWNHRWERMNVTQWFLNFPWEWSRVVFLKVSELGCLDWPSVLIWAGGHWVFLVFPG